MHIINFKPSQREGNVIGFLTLSLDVMVKDEVLNPTLDVTIMRNSNDGSIFIAWPSRSYKDESGANKFISHIFWPREQSDFIQRHILELFKIYNKNMAQDTSRAQSQPKQDSFPDSLNF